MVKFEAYSKVRGTFGPAAPHVYEAVSARIDAFSAHNILLTWEEAVCDLFGADVRVRK